MAQALLESEHICLHNAWIEIEASISRASLGLDYLFQVAMFWRIEANVALQLLVHVLQAGRHLNRQTSLREVEPLIPTASSNPKVTPGKMLQPPLLPFVPLFLHDENRM